MSTATDVRHVPNALGRDDRGAAQPAPGFTAVNGRTSTETSYHPQSPTQDSAPREQALAAATLSGGNTNASDMTSSNAGSPSRAPSESPHPPQQDARASPGKRKRSVSDNNSSRSRTTSPSRRYRSPAIDHTGRETPQFNSAVPDQIESNGSSTSTSGQNGHHTNGMTSLEPDTRYGDPNAPQWSSQRDGELQDAQFAEALTRGTQQLSDTSNQLDHQLETGVDPKFAVNTSPGPPQQPQSATTNQIGSNGQLTSSFQKQRKRNFSNRTKTGCLTCRSRKKKCDEAKPTCKNCERGGFTCQGYSQTGSLYKGSNISASVAPLQAKSGGSFYDPFSFSSHNRPAPSSAQNTFFPEHAPHAPVADRDRNLSGTQETHVRAPYSRPSWSESQQNPPFPQDGFAPSPALTDHRGERTLPPPPNAQPTTSQRSGSSSSHYTHLAQSALQHSGNNNRSVTQQPQPYWSEKEKMIQGHPFIRNDSQLIEDRKQCATACHKFNLNASDPQNLTDAERYARFRQIIQPKSSTAAALSQPGQDTSGEGSVGERVTVEAPFNCEYGYNIAIGDDTEIGPGCRIMDSCTVKIGARCYIGPNVTFYTTEGDQQPAQLGPGGRKQKRLTRASAIIVEDDVYIAGNVIIQPGQRIGNSATIAAGTMLDRNVKSTYSVYPDTKHGGADIVTGSWRPQQHPATLS